MVLYKLEDFDPKYQEAWDGDDIKGYDVYAGRNNDDKVGTVKNILLDEFGRFRYFVIDTGFWIFGKQVLLPVGRSRIDQNKHRLYAVGFTKEQAEHLPEFNSDLKVDYAYEDSVRGAYYNNRAPETPLEISTPVESAIPVELSAPLDAVTAYRTPARVEVPNPTPPRPVAAKQQTYQYEQDPALYEMNDQDHQTLKLYEERLIANKSRMKTGEVTVNKVVETENARVTVPVEKERIVVEHTTPNNAKAAVSPGANAFREGEIMQMEIYEETADIHKEAFVTEEVNIHKEVKHDTVTGKEKLRREKLNIDTQGTDKPIVDKKV